MGLKNKITYEYLKQHIGCTKVFEHYFGSFDLSTSYHSPLRKDNKKSVGFFINDNGSVVYNDFAEDTKYNFVQFVAKLLNISYYGAIEHISSTFKLNTSRLINFNNTVVQPVKQVKKKPKSVFKVVTRPFTKQDLQWWGQFAVTKQELITNNVYSVAKYNINDYTIYTQKNELRFAYLLKDNDTGSAYFKIYTPLDKERKWMFNGKLDLVYGLDKLSCGNLTQPFSTTLVITKSIKDYIVLKKFFPEVIALQNESKSALNKKTIKALKKCYTNILCFFDTDRAGLSAMWWYRKHYNFTPVFFRNTKLSIWQNLTKNKQISDPADFVKTYGIINFEKWLKINKLL